jgi:hypothetical protein
MRSTLALVLVLAAGCGPITEFRLRTGDTFTLGVGDTASVAELNLWLRFSRVTDDSRCPSQGVCVWAGDAAVVLELAPLVGDSKLDTLHTTLDPQSVPVGGAELHLVRLDPYPETAGSIPAGAYRVTLVTRPRATN